jgi:twitching motility protein PilT
MQDQQVPDFFEESEAEQTAFMAPITNIDELLSSGPRSDQGARTGRRLPIGEAHVDDMLRLVLEKGASDLHLAVDAPPIIRIDGELVDTNYEKVNNIEMQRLCYDILNDEQIHRYETDWELDFSYSLANIARFRVNYFRERGNVAAAFRYIPARIPTLEELELPPILADLSRKPRGLIVFTGPTGSGKTTSQAAMINQMNNERSVHIITIEDPIEYMHKHKYSIIHQRELGQDTKTFAGALRSALREDPDVILVGEMRDLETISTAISCAETGHLVIATLHTNNAAQTVDRMVDVFPPSQQDQIRIQLSNNIEAVICQQLLKRAGTPGRICAMEVMLATPAIRNLIREGKAHQITSTIQTSTSMGMMTLDMSLRDLYLRGKITYDDAITVANSPEELKRMLTTPVGASSSGAMEYDSSLAKAPPPERR